MSNIQNSNKAKLMNEFFHTLMTAVMQTDPIVERYEKEFIKEKEVNGKIVETKLITDGENGPDTKGN